MTEIKSKESIYKGFIFKSMLEKRWAVFFDQCGYTWSYEPEWFTLPGGEKYKPDFYVKELGLYVETKPFNTNIVKYVGDGNVWEKKCERFRDTTGYAILLCYGYPYDDIMKALFAYDYTDSAAGSSGPYICNFVIHQDRIVLCTGEDRKDRVICTNYDFDNNKYVGTTYQLCGDSSLARQLPQIYNYKLNDILNQAKATAWLARQYDQK